MSSPRSSRSRRLLRATLVGMLLAALPASSGAEPFHLSIRSSLPVTLGGEIAVDAPEGIARIEDPNATGVVSLRGLTGDLEIWTYESMSAVGETPFLVSASPAKPAPTPVERHRLEDARVEIRLSREPLTLTAVARPGSSLEVAGGVPAAGLPLALPQDAADAATDPWAPSPYSIPFQWRAGWQLVGALDATRPALGRGFPDFAAGRLGFAGPIDLLESGGNLTVTNGDGAEIRFRTGSWPDPTVPASVAAGVPAPHVASWAVFRGTVEEATVPDGTAWGVAAPSLVWRVAGRAEWEDASGEGPLSLVGDLRIAPVDLAGADGTRYEVTGRLDSSSVEIPTGVGGRTSAAAEATVALAAAGLLRAALTRAGRALVGRALAAMYTRLSPADVVSHPYRRRILDALRESPGVHLRDLQRIVGGAWGKLSFHVRVLERHGSLRLDRCGRHVVVSLAGVPRGPPRVPGAQARRIVDALPEDGSAVPFAEISARLGMSRQLLAHHLAKLRALGVVRTTGRPVMVSRAAGAPDPEGKRLHQ